MKQFISAALMFFCTALAQAQVPTLEYVKTDSPPPEVLEQAKVALENCMQRQEADCDKKILILDKPSTEVSYNEVTEPGTYVIDDAFQAPFKKKEPAFEVNTVFGGTIESGAYCPTKWLYVSGDYYKYTRENIINGQFEVGLNLKQGLGSDLTESRLGVAYTRNVDGTQAFGVRIIQKGVLNIFKLND